MKETPFLLRLWSKRPWAKSADVESSRLLVEELLRRFPESQVL